MGAGADSEAFEETHGEWVAAGSCGGIFVAGALAWDSLADVAQGRKALLDGGIEYAPGVEWVVEVVGESMVVVMGLRAVGYRSCWVLHGSSLLGVILGVLTFLLVIFVGLGRI